MDTLNRVEQTEHTLQFVPIGYIECTHACNCDMYILNFDAKIN